MKYGDRLKDHILAQSEVKPNAAKQSLVGLSTTQVSPLTESFKNETLRNS